MLLTFLYGNFIIHIISYLVGISFKSQHDCSHEVKRLEDFYFFKWTKFSIPILCLISSPPHLLSTIYFISKNMLSLYFLTSLIEICFWDTSAAHVEELQACRLTGTPEHTKICSGVLQGRPGLHYRHRLQTSTRN